MTERRNSLDAKFGNLNLQEDGNHDVIRADALTASNRTATLEEDLASIDDDVASLKEASKCFTKTVCVFSNTLIEVASGAKSSALPDPQTISDYSIATSSEEIKIMSLLQIFDQPIRCIIKAVLDDMKYGRVLWRVAERCYKQAINPFGTLNAGKHFIGLKQFQPGQTLNGDHKSERYHEQENGSDIPENVHAALHAQAEGLDEGGRKEEQLWIKFWLNILDHSPGGPTLFFPQESNHTDHPSLDNIPRYLFRAFDEKSSGKNDEKVMASPGSHKTPQGRPNDFMSLDDLDATKLLYYHLCEKWTGRQDYNDVLVSWTSSFLYAVQCAIWRHHNPQIRSTSNKICIVDTNQFPQGQFIRDLELLARYLPMAKDLGGSVLNFFEFRPKSGDYYNGEFLSQGVVNHAGRSCVVSLEQLQESGLFKLYPEFGDPEEQGRWTNRVKDLRRQWWYENETTNEDISHALNIARTCFRPFEANEVACLLLSFKNRELSSTVQPPFKEAPSWADKPVEVKRYWQAFEKLEFLKQGRQRDVELREIFA